MISTNLIIFGATGNLSTKKLFPALFELEKQNLLPSKIKILGLASQTLTNYEFTQLVKNEIAAKTENFNFIDKKLAGFMARINYLTVNFEEPTSFETLKDQELIKSDSLYYFAT